MPWLKRLFAWQPACPCQRLQRICLHGHQPIPYGKKYRPQHRQRLRHQFDHTNFVLLLLMIHQIVFLTVQTCVNASWIYKTVNNNAVTLRSLMYIVNTLYE